MRKLEESKLNPLLCWARILVSNKESNEIAFCRFCWKSCREQCVYFAGYQAVVERESIQNLATVNSSKCKESLRLGGCKLEP